MGTPFMHYHKKDLYEWFPNFSGVHSTYIIFVLLEAQFGGPNKYGRSRVVRYNRV